MPSSPILRPLCCLATVVASFVFSASALSAETELLTNPGFEKGFDDWTASPEDTSQSLSKVTADSAHSGKSGLHVTQTGEVKISGSSLSSPMLAAAPGDTFQIDFWARCQSESGLGVFLQYFDSNKRLLTLPPKSFFVAIPSKATDWTPLRIEGAAPDGTAFVNVWIHGWSTAKCDVDLDDFSLKQIPPGKR